MLGFSTIEDIGIANFDVALISDFFVSVAILESHSELPYSST